MTLDTEVIPVFQRARINTGYYGNPQLIGYAYPDQDINDVMVHITVPHRVTSRSQISRDPETGYYMLTEQELGRTFKYPIARTTFDWDSKTNPQGTTAMTELTNELQRRITAQETERKGLAALTTNPRAWVDQPFRSSVLHPGKPAEKPWGVKDPAPEEELYSLLRPFMLGKHVKIRVEKVKDDKNALVYEYVGTLANYVVAYDPETGDPNFLTFRFTLMVENEDFSLDMKAYSLEIELISVS